jgi:hypothetical protein
MPWQLLLSINDEIISYTYPRSHILRNKLGVFGSKIDIRFDCFDTLGLSIQINKFILFFFFNETIKSMEKKNLGPN